MARKKAKKDRDKNKKSLKSMVEEMEKVETKLETKLEQDESSSEDPIQGGLSMIVKDDVQGSVFWDFVHELFFNQVNLGLKLRKKFK